MSFPLQQVLKKPEPLIILLITLALVTLVLDLVIPDIITGGIPYVAIIVLTLWLKDKKEIITVAVICTIFAAIGMVYSQIDVINMVDIEKRGLVLLIIWSVALLVLLRHETMLAYASSEKRYRILHDNNPSMYFSVDSEGNVLTVNKFGANQLGYSPNELIGKSVLGVFHSTEHNAVKNHLKICLENQDKTHQWDIQKIRKDGTKLWVRETARCLKTNGDTPIVFIVCDDITQEKEAGVALNRSHRALKVLHKCNQALIHINKERELLNNICQIVVETGGYRFVWVGFSEQDEQKTVRPIAQAGYEDGYLDTIVVTWADNQYGHGPIGTAIRTGKPSIIKNISADPDFTPWRELAIEHGYSSVIGLPLKLNGLTIGALAIYAPEVDVFDKEEVKLLEDLASNLSYGISSLRTEIERKQAQEKLNELNMALTNAMPGISRMDHNGHYLYVNDAYAGMLGYTPNELLGLSWEPTVHEDDRSLAITAVQTAIKEGKGEFEARAIRKDGSEFFKQVLIVAIIGKDGQVVGHHCFMKDISERKNAEINLANRANQHICNQKILFELAKKDYSNQETPFNHIIKIAAEQLKVERVSVWLFNQEHTEIVCKALYQEGKFNNEEQILKSCDYPRYFHALETNGRISANDANTDTNTSEFSDNYLTPLGITSMLDVPIYIQGEMVGIICHEQIGSKRNWAVEDEDFTNSISDLCALALAATKRKQVEDTLRESNERIKAAFADATIGMALVSLDHSIIETNQAFSNMLGYSKDELVGIFFNAITHPDDADKSLEHHHKLINGEIDSYQLEKRYLHKLGHDIWALLSVSLVRGKDTIPLYAIAQMQDITERKLAKEALQKSEQQLHLITESLPVCISYIDAEQRYQYCNSNFEKYLKNQNKSVIGKHMSNILSKKAYAATRHHIEGGLSGTPVQYEYEHMTEDGNQLTYDVTYVPHFGSDGKVIGLYIMSSDITERKKLERQLIQAQKMEALGQLTGGIAHDFNNLLTVIKGNLQLLEENFNVKENDPDLINELINDSYSAADDATALNQQLLAFSHKQPLKPKQIEINTFIETSIRYLLSILGDNIELKKKLKKIKSVGWFDPNQFETALLNLAINARDAMPDGGTLTIQTGAQKVSKAISRKNNLAEGNYITVTVTDTGTGMEPEVISHAIEPFYTTKDVGKGSGLGLSMVYGFVTQTGGGMQIKSTVNKGTSVIIYLPAVTQIKTDKKKSVRNKPPVAGGDELILVVEDNKRVRTFTIRALKSLGYQVIEAMDGAEAIDILENNHSIDLVFSDNVLPGHMKGRELADYVNKRYPNIKILLTTGYSKEIDTINSVYDDMFPFLKKPFTKIELGKIIRTELDNMVT